MLSSFSEAFGYLLLAFGLLVIVPFAWNVLDPVTILEEDLLSSQDNVSIPDDIRAAVVHSSVIAGFTLGLALWVQGADRKTSGRVLQRTPPNRVFCKDCSADAQVPRLILYVLTALAWAFFLLGVYFAWNNSGVSSLRLSTIGLAIYILRSEVAMLTGKLIE